jgi:hypothetical protein
MGWPSACRTVFLTIIVLSVTARKPLQASDRITTLPSVGNGPTRQQSIRRGQNLLFFVKNFKGLSSAISREQLSHIKARSVFTVTVDALAAQLNTDGDLVGAT